MGVTVKVSVRRKALDDMISAMRKIGAKGASVDIGLFERDGFRLEKGDVDVSKGLPLTNPEIAAILEYGTRDGRIPGRYFLSDPVRSTEKRILGYVAKTFGGIMEQQQHPENAAHYMRQALEIGGSLAVGEVQKYMARGAMIPNAESTIREKGSSQPTIDTGQLRQAVTYRVRIEGEEHDAAA